MATTASPFRPAGLSRLEFTGLLSMVMAGTALGIDLMLPAFPAMREEFGLAADATAITGVVTAYFVGLALAQAVWGPVTDRFGRKPTLTVGLLLYGLGAIGSALAPGLLALFVARFLWGVGAAGPRVVALAVVRDIFSGERMARAMSFIMAVFILVPVLAPSLGAVVVSVAGWRWVFGFCALFAAAVWLWSRRLPETLPEDRRRELRLRPVLVAARYVVSNRQTLGYTLALTALFGVFTSYLASSEIIFSEVFGRPDQFPLIFGGLAAVMGAAMLANGAVVERVGTRRLLHSVLIGYLGGAGLLAWWVLSEGGRPPFWPFALGLAAMLSFHALLIPNMNTVAMDPMGSIAGTAAAVIGTVSTAGGATLGAFLDQAFDGTVGPISLGFVGYGAVAMAFVLWAERGRLFRPLSPQ